jgi:hypothetical protein
MMSRTTILPDNSLAMVGTCIKTDKGLLTAGFFFASSLGKDLRKDVCFGRIVCQAAAAEDAKGGDGYLGGEAADELGGLLHLFFSFVVVNKVGDELMEAMMACGVEWWFRHVMAIADGGGIHLLCREGETTTISTSSHTPHKWREGNLARYGISLNCPIP